MAKSTVSQFTFDFKTILIDEIALEGLEGIGFDLLWRRIEKRISAAITDKMKSRLWSFIVSCEAISCYHLPEPLPRFELGNRVDLVDEESGLLLEPEDYLDGPYEYFPVEKDYGSCKYYNTRKLIPRDAIQNQPYEKVNETFNNYLVMVASAEERFKALAPSKPSVILKDLSKNQYCILELIGKARENGQMTTGKTNLVKIIKDPKLLFYNKKFLAERDLIREFPTHTVIAGKGWASVMLTLTKFERPYLENMPKEGKLANVFNHLLNKPNYEDNAKDMMSLGVFDLKFCKRLFKNQNVFTFEDLPNPKKNKRYKEMSVKKIHLELNSEESSQSDNENNEEQLKPQYKVKVSLLRQAYKLVVESGINGLSLMEIAQLLGIEFYTARSIFRAFKSKNIVREFFVDKGKQKIAKYIAVEAANTAVNTRYEEEKNKFLENIKQVPGNKRELEVPVNSHESDEEIPNKRPKLDNDEVTETPNKKPKLENDDVTNYVPDSNTIRERVVEIKYLDGCKNVDKTFFEPGKMPTLRQLRYANGILHIIREKEVLLGYQTLNQLVSKITKESPMDVRWLKVLLQKLVYNGQIKLFKMNWPHHNKTCIVMCATHVTVDSPLIKTKYKEINRKALTTQRQTKLEMISSLPVDKTVIRPLVMTMYPRYMKIQKMHEAIMKYVYFNETDTNKPSSGFCSLVDIIPDFTVDYVLGCLNSSTLISMLNMKIPNQLLHQKVKDIPANFMKIFLTSYNLQNTWRQNLKVLSMLGLIQLIRQPNESREEKSYVSYDFFVNPRAKIIDTTGEWPRQNVDKKSLERYYNFETFADVENFWKDVHNICIHTEITLDRAKRILKSPVCVPVLKEEVAYTGYAEIYGDGTGCCGFHPSFYMELQRSWAACQTHLKQQALLKKTTHIPRPKKTRVVKKRAIRKKAPIKKRNIDNKPLTTTQQGKKRTRSKVLHVKWSKEEDDLLLMCSAAATIISPSITCYKLRNNVAKDLLAISDPNKTPTLCHTRATYLNSNPRLTYRKDYVINEFKRHPQASREYEDILRVFKFQYAGNWKVIYPKLRIKLLELVWILYHMVRSDSFIKKKPCVALNAEDFHNKFIITNSSTSKDLFTYKTENDVEPKIAAIKEGIIFAVMASYKPTPIPNSAELILDMFNPFPEKVLRPAMTQLWKAGAVAAKEKFMANAIAKFLTKDVVHSSYKISSFYARRWICRLNSDFIENLMHTVDEDLPTLIKGSSETNCVLSELKGCGIIDIESATVPAIAGSTGSVVIEDQMSIADMSSKLKLKSGTLTWTSKKKFQKVSDLYERIDYEERFEELKRNSLLVIQEDYEEKDMIIKILTEKERGMTFKDMQDATGLDTKELITKLRNLESSHVIKRVGYYENFIVLTKFAKAWTMSLGGQYILPTPWFTLDQSIKLIVFIKWLSTVMNKIFMHPGCSVSYISDELQYISMRATQELCNFLEKCKCVYIKCIRCKEPDLFSDDEAEMSELEDFNEYDSVHNILIFPAKDALTRFACIRAKLLSEET